MSCPLDDTSLTYYCHVREGEPTQDGEYLIWYDAYAEGWHACGMEARGHWYDSDLCGMPSEWLRCYGNLSLNECRLEVMTCAECGGYILKVDYLCDKCR